MDLVCPECNASISFASASIVASCTLCGADLDLPSAEPVEVQIAPAGQASGD
jgi:ribosomal protein S27E